LYRIASGVAYAAGSWIRRTKLGRSAGKRHGDRNDSVKTIEREGSSAMKILYGVVGEGLGHAMRSRVIL
jgi:hypothetical protein